MISVLKAISVRPPRRDVGIDPRSEENNLGAPTGEPAEKVPYKRKKACAESTSLLFRYFIFCCIAQ